jgi:tetratricopeptide (TPR) repeat protein
VDDLAKGREHQRAGRLSDAEAYYRRFLDRHPDHAGGSAALGVVALGQRDLDEAVHCSLRSLALRSGTTDTLADFGVAPFFEAYRNLGHALRDQGKLAEAVQAYQQARELRPDDIDVLSSLGSALYQANRAAEGIEPLVEAVRLAPRAVNLHQRLGIALMGAKRFDEAVAAFRRALALDPTDANSYSGLGVVQTEARRFDEAEASCREAIRLDPDLVEAHQNLGNVFFARNHYDEALACYATAIRLRPDSPDLHYNVGLTFGRIGRHEESIRADDRATALDPKHLDARQHRAITKLLLGNYLEGFREYECRWELNGSMPLDFDQPAWKGESIAGKTILLVAEQGFGDTIQFVRFAPMVKALGATVVFRCFAPLLKLFDKVPGIDTLIPDGEPLPAFDVYAPLMSLPIIFRTSLEDIRGIQPVPYLRAEPELVERWKERLGPRAPRELRVGIFWQGNPTHSDDRSRSAPLSAFVPLANVSGVKLISIQKGHGVEQIAPLTGCLSLLDFRESTRFEDTAALMSLLDVMITIDSAPVHLAGALGVPTWLAVSTFSEWRWLVGREDTPWYPTVRIFRQSEPHNWGDVFTRMVRALAGWAASSRVDSSLLLPKRGRCLAGMLPTPQDEEPARARRTSMSGASRLGGDVADD